MAIFRNVNMSFWTDPKIVDEYTPEDRYFMLWALTNNYTNIIGCYEISIKQMSNDLGYTKDVVENLLKRFTEIHKTIMYDFETKELIVINWHKYNWSSSPKLDIPLYTAIENIKSDLFHDKLATIYNQRESVNAEEYDEEGNKKDIVLIPYRYGMDTTNSNSNRNRNRNRNRIEIDIINSPSFAEAETSNNDNDNDVSYYDSSHDTSNDSLEIDLDKKLTKKDTRAIPIIIDYMNACGELENFKIKKTFRFNSKAKSNQKIIRERLNENCYTINDFKDVIYNAYSKFIEHEFKGYNGKPSIQYYNPSTIFTSSKMEKYKNEYENL